MITKDLNKKDWQMLMDYNITDSEGNGFANTTKKADIELRILKTPTLIRLKGKTTIYVVRYVSGCFYPFWHKLSHGATVEQLKEVIEVDKL